MSSRWLTLLIVVYWGASMIWLTSTKLLPVLRPGDQPIPRGWDPGAHRQPVKVRWQILIQGGLVGTATNEITARDFAGWRVHSTVDFKKLPLRLIVTELFGGLSGMVQPMLGSREELPLAMQVVTRMECSAAGQPERFHARVKVREMEDVVDLRGEMREGKLHLLVTAADLMEGGRGKRMELYRHEMPVVPDAMFADSLAPSPRLLHLRVGQEWTFHSYRPFPPTRPLRLMRGVVAREDLVLWDGQLEPVHVVELYDEEGGTISAARRPTSRMWVRKDGEVLRQEVALGDLRIEFVRMVELPAAVNGEGGPR